MLVLCLLLASCSSPPVQKQGWQEVFRDDFTGTALSAQNWLYDLGTCYPGCPAPQWGTGEIEEMTEAAVRVSGGHLSITPALAGGKWTSGRIETQQRAFAAPPGGTLRAEASVQLPQGTPAELAGYWPAFWLLGGKLRDGYTGWPGVGEIDVLEQVNGRPAVFGTFHCGTFPGGPCKEPAGLGSGERACAACLTGFHTYAIEQDAAEIRWYVDGVLGQTVRAADVEPAAWRQATQGFMLILNVAMGGGLPAAFGGGVTPATVPGRPMLVDWVAVSVKGQ